MPYIPISLPGMLDTTNPGGVGDPNIQSSVTSPLYDSNIVLFAPMVSVAPVGLPLVIHLQTVPGQLAPNFIEAIIQPGEYFAIPVVGNLFITAERPIWIRIMSGPVGANAASYLGGFFEITDGSSIASLEDVTKSSLERQISSIINRGTQFDHYIPAAVRRAVRFFETGNNFPYMRKILSFPKIPTGTTEEQSTSVVLGQDIKRLHCVRRYDPAGASREYTYLTGVDADDVEELKPSTDPEFYTTTFQDVTTDLYSGPALNIHLGCLSFLSTFQLEAVVYRYTNYRTIRFADDHWLLSIGESVLLGQAMINLAPIIRQPDAIALWAPVVSAGLKNLLLAADEIDVDQHAQQMGY
jgi:hypothetical protein